MRAGYVAPAALGGLEIADDNRAIVLRVDSAPDREGQWRETAEVRRFVRRSTGLEFERYHSEPGNVLLLVRGPSRELDRLFGCAAAWPAWAREVRGRDTSTVCEMRLPSAKILSPVAVVQSEVRRDRFARMPANAAPKIKRAIRYVRAGQDERRRIDPAGPRSPLTGQAAQDTVVLDRQGLGD